MVNIPYETPDVNQINTNRHGAETTLQDYLLSGYIFGTKLGNDFSDVDSLPATEHISIDRNDNFICDDNFDIENASIEGQSVTNNQIELMNLIKFHRNFIVPAYRIKANYYKGRALSILKRKPIIMGRDDYRVALNLPKKIINSFIGYFVGTPPRFSYNPDVDVTQTINDELKQQVTSQDSNGTSQNNDVAQFDSTIQEDPQTQTIQKSLQDFLSKNNYDEFTAEIARLSALDGRAYVQVWSDEGGENVQFREISPANAFVVYSSDVKELKPKFGVTYYDNNGHISGELICPTKVYPFEYSTSDNPTKNTTQSTADLELPNKEDIFDSAIKREFDDLDDNPILSLIEKPHNREHVGMIDDLISIFDAINETISTKTNSVAYFNNAYMKVTGVKLTQDQLDEMAQEHVFNLYVNNNLSQKNMIAPDVDFIAPPDNDETQEHLLDRLIQEAYDIASVVNLNDPSMGQTASGEALDRKLQPMQLMASDQKRSMNKMFQKIFEIFFYCAHLQKSTIPVDGFNNVEITFVQNKPHNLVDETTAAKNMIGVTSLKTALKPISIINDPDKEVQSILLDKLQNAKIGKLLSAQESNLDLNPATNKPNIINNPNGNKEQSSGQPTTDNQPTNPIDPKQTDITPPQNNSNDN